MANAVSIFYLVAAREVENFYSWVLLINFQSSPESLAQLHSSIENERKGKVNNTFLQFFVNLKPLSKKIVILSQKCYMCTWKMFLLSSRSRIHEHTIILRVLRLEVSGMDFLNRREGGMGFYQVFLLSPLQCTIAEL